MPEATPFCVHYFALLYFGPVDISTLSKEDMLSYLVNKGLDGDMDAVNACEDKMIRARLKL